MGEEGESTHNQEPKAEGETRGFRSHFTWIVLGV